MRAYGEKDARSGAQKFTCCDRVSGCEGKHPRQQRLRRVWRKRARAAGKRACEVAEE